MCLGLSAESEGSDQAQVLDSAFSIPSLRVHLWVQFCDMAIFYPFGHRRLVNPWLSIAMRNAMTQSVK